MQSYYVLVTVLQAPIIEGFTVIGSLFLVSCPATSILGLGPF